MSVITLDVLVATFRRDTFLPGLLASLTDARIPSSLSITVTVVDNSSDGDARSTVERVAASAPVLIRYQHEPTPGKSAALNAGIENTTGELVAFLDDDETIDPGWYEAIVECFSDATVDFISGRAAPVWPSRDRPHWLPRNYPAVIGIADSGAAVRPFTHEFCGTLSGGNSAVRREALKRAGLFSPRLGPRSDCRLLCGEDEDLSFRLLESGARGLYVPSLRVNHAVHASRLTRRYHRQWCFWRGVSKALIHENRPVDVPHLVGVPRYLFRAALRGIGPWLRPDRPAHERFSGELACWDLAGFFYGRHWYRRRPIAATASVTAPAAPAATEASPPCGAVAAG